MCGNYHRNEKKNTSRDGQLPIGPRCVYRNDPKRWITVGPKGDRKHCMWHRSTCAPIGCTQN